MAKNEILLDVKDDSTEEQALPTVCFVARCYPADSRGFVHLSAECSSMEELLQEAEELKQRIDDLERQAVDLFARYEASPSVEQQRFATVEEAWQALEECASLAEMQSIFNNLDKETRLQIADYVFTRTNIFKGAASTFSQHYNEVDSVLE
ncbi:MAG: hypothetical protein JRJ12_01685 [Deltaproteobacteria bacterium]|nr:hypothetical protein [Deltaproteobacteria bacterium]MBW2069921.1 hypothetical protein [Deltaproteobacteria bacterium]